MADRIPVEEYRRRVLSPETIQAQVELVQTFSTGNPNLRSRIPLPLEPVYPDPPLVVWICTPPGFEGTTVMDMRGLYYRPCTFSIKGMSFRANGRPFAGRSTSHGRVNVPATLAAQKEWSKTHAWISEAHHAELKSIEQDFADEVYAQCALAGLETGTIREGGRYLRNSRYIRLGDVAVAHYTTLLPRLNRANNPNEVWVYGVNQIGSSVSQVPETDLCPTTVKVS